MDSPEYTECCRILGEWLGAQGRLTDGVSAHFRAVISGPGGLGLGGYLFGNSTSWFHVLLDGTVTEEPEEARRMVSL